MKKLTAALLTASMIFSCSVCGAGAAGRTASVSEKIADASEIHILYNDTVVQYEDVKPVNTDGRVMIPFRAALENMGATVNYDDAARLVTATKGDITISFTLMDDTIYVDKNGEQSTVTMDVPMIIVEDRTLVPIRFMSNAFDMQVGWDGDTQTVIIMDYDDYLDEFEAAAPNMAKLTELQAPKFNKSSVEFAFELGYDNNGEAVNIKTSGTLLTETAENTSKTTAKLDFDGMGISAKDASAEMIFKDGKLYVKTSLIEQIAKNSGSAELSAAAALSGDTWYSIDIAQVIDSMDISESEKALLKDWLSKNTANLTANVFEGINKEGDAVINDALRLTAMLDMYESVDKHISVTDNGNGAYSISVNITNDDFISMISSDMFAGTMSAEEIQTLKDMMSVSISAKDECDGEKEQSNINLSAGVNAQGENMKLTFTGSEASENDPSVTAAQIPESSVDITSIILGK